MKTLSGIWCPPKRCLWILCFNRILTLYLESFKSFQLSLMLVQAIYQVIVKGKSIYREMFYCQCFTACNAERLAVSKYIYPSTSQDWSTILQELHNTVKGKLYFEYLPLHVFFLIFCRMTNLAKKFGMLFGNHFLPSGLWPGPLFLEPHPTGAWHTTTRP